MDMHGMFFDFPKTFSAANTGGLRPIARHLRYIPDFCDWNGRLVLATDETSIQGNPMAGQPQSNLWFGQYEDLEEVGTGQRLRRPLGGRQDRGRRRLRSAADRRLRPADAAPGLGGEKPPNHRPASQLRASDGQEIKSIPRSLAVLPRVTIDRGDYHKPAPGYSFRVNRPVTVYLAVDVRGNPDLGGGLDEDRTLTMTWGNGIIGTLSTAAISTPAQVEIPGNARSTNRAISACPTPPLSPARPKI